MSVIVRDPASPDHSASETAPTSSDLLAALAAHFAASEVQWKPGATAQSPQGSRAMALPFVNASAIQERLDAVVGVGWEARYEFLAGGAVLCCLRLFLDGSWHERCDVGQCGKDEGNGIKAGVSDSFKRAARAWGIGRYLTRIPKQWVGYDASKRRFTQEPQLPAWAVPAQRPVVEKVLQPIAPKPEPVIPAADLSDDEPGPGGRINESQEQSLVKLLREKQADVAKFLSFFQVRALGQLPAKEFDRARQMLQAKPANNGKR
jgi:hypothetical protein